MKTNRTPVPEKNLKALIAKRERNVIDTLKTTGDLSIDEVSQLTGLPKSTAYRTITRLHKKQEVHIRSWRRPDGRGNMIRVFRAGKGKDKDKPEMSTPADRSRAYRERHKALISLRRSKDKSRFAGVWAGAMALIERTK